MFVIEYDDTMTQAARLNELEEVYLQKPEEHLNNRPVLVTH
jgi:hypothetical protein